MSEFDEHTTSPEDRVSWNQLFAYGMGGIVPIALFNIAGQLTQLLGNISLGLSAMWLGIILMIPRLWDAISDPLVGHLSDNTRTPWGRRRPYILIGGIAVAVTFAAMWWVPRGTWIHSLLPSESSYNVFQFVYIMVGVVCFFTACTVFEIPHGALGMEMSSDYHERTRLFSAKSFFGNFFAMGTPWLLYLASLEVIRGPGGNLADGMRYLSLFVAAAILPLSYWWFLALREPAFQVVQSQAKSSLWTDLNIARKNKTFLKLVAIIFILAMGFNFVNIFSYYITIYYLYGGDEGPAARLLGLNGTLWAITGLLAVFPLNWISRRFGKTKTLLLAILLMCSAQLTKIVCYDPAHPYLLLIPTVLLSSGMLMFFTLGSSMVGDVCDEDELHTGKRSEGTYYSVYWWFIKMGTAFASFVMGALIVFTQFDERQNKLSADIYNATGGIIAKVEKLSSTREELTQDLQNVQQDLADLQEHLTTEAEKESELQSHYAELSERFDAVQQAADKLAEATSAIESADPTLQGRWKELRTDVSVLRKQAPATLFRLRAVEIGLPLVLSLFSISLTLLYPLTEERCYQVKAELKKRRAEIAATQPGG